MCVPLLMIAARAFEVDLPAEDRGQEIFEDRRLTLHWEQMMDALEAPLTISVIEKIEKIFEQYSELHDTFSSDHAIKMVRRLHPLIF